MTIIHPTIGTHKKQYRGISLDCCTKEQLIECIEGMQRNVDSLRRERDKYEKQYYTLLNGMDFVGPKRNGDIETAVPGYQHNKS